MIFVFFPHHEMVSGIRVRGQRRAGAKLGNEHVPSRKWFNYDVQFRKLCIYNTIIYYDTLYFHRISHFRYFISSLPTGADESWTQSDLQKCLEFSSGSPFQWPWYPLVVLILILLWKLWKIMEIAH